MFGAVDLSAGEHSIRVSHYEQGGGAAIEVGVASQPGDFTGGGGRYLLLSTPDPVQSLLLHYEFEDGVTRNPRNTGIGLIGDGTVLAREGEADRAHNLDSFESFRTLSPSVGGHGNFSTDGNSFIDTNGTSDQLSANGAVDYTQMAWMNPNNPRTGDQMIFGQRVGNALHNGIRNGRMHIGHWGNDLNAGAVTVDFNQWQHVAFTYKGGTQAIYINGVKRAEEDHGPLNNPANIVIGQARDEAGRSFEGTLDDVRIYSVALDGAQISSIAGFGDSDGDGLADWRERANFGDLSQSGADDADGDGLNNAGEEQQGSDPLLADSDGDGASDLSEFAGKTDPNNSDTDGDGLLDGEEVAGGCPNPLVSDSDGDGVDDGREVENFSDPCDPDSVPEPLPSGLIAYWTFDTDANDTIGGIAGTLAGGAALTADGGGFTGEAGDNAADLGALNGGQHVNVTDVNRLNKAFDNDTVTVTMWQKWDQAVGNQSGFWFHARSSPSGQRGFQAHTPWSNGTIFFDTAGCCGGGDTRIAGPPPEGTDYLAWNHFAFTKNGAAKKVYVNGVLAFEGNNTNPLPTDLNRLTIGSGENGSNSHGGRIDDFAVYNGELSLEEILSLADQSATPLDFLGTPRDILELIGTGTDSLLGGDLTDPENDGEADADNGYNAVFASSEEEGFGGGEFAFNVFDNRLGGGNDKWCCGAAFPLSVDATFESPFALTHFTVSSANDVPGRDPTVWEIQGSNDGENFETIFGQASDTAVWDQRLQVALVTLGVPSNPYTTFRFITFETGLTSGAFYQVGEIELFGNPGEAKIGIGSDHAATDVDSAGARMNIENADGTFPTLGAGDYDVTDFQYSNSADSSNIQPFLATLTGEDAYSVVWVGPTAAAPGTDNIVATPYEPGTQQFSLGADAAVYAGFNAAGPNVKFGAGITDHANPANFDIAVGSDISGFGHANLTRSYAFEINVAIAAPGPLFQDALVGCWFFDDLSDSSPGGYFPDLELKGDAAIVNGSLDVNGGGTNATGWAVTGGNYSGPEITDKTLVAWATLQGLEDVAKAGSLLTIDRTSGDIFDGIIFAERQTNRWMNGSSGFQRTKDFAPGFEETTTGDQVILAISYDNDGNNTQVTGYRNGVQIGQYDDEPASSWATGDAEVFFGKRHGHKDGGPGALDALIHEARIYNRVLTPAEVAMFQPVAVAGGGPTQLVWDFENGLSDQTGTVAFNLVTPELGDAFDRGDEGVPSQPVRYDEINDESSITDTPGGGENNWLIRADWGRQGDVQTKHGDGDTGAFISETFTIGADSAFTMDVGGGSDPNGLFLHRASDDSVIISESRGGGFVNQRGWTAEELGGAGVDGPTDVYLRIADATTAGWGNVSVDNIVADNVLPSAAGQLAALPRDTDGDGMTDEYEAIAGTDPFDRTSVLHISSVEATDRGFLMTISSVPGITYEIEYSESLEPDSWKSLDTVKSDGSETVLEIENFLDYGRQAGYFRAKVKD